MYVVSVTPHAQRDIDRLRTKTIRDDFERIAGGIRSLAEDPRPPGCRKITGGTNSFRIRVGDYRIVYDVRDAEKLVLIIKVGRRNESTYDF